MSRFSPDVYGRRPVLEALRADHVERVYVAREARDAPVLREISAAARDAGVPVQAVPRAELDRALTGRNHQGVAAGYRTHDYASLDQIVAITERADEPGLILALDGVQDPGNVGSLLRTAEAAGAHGVVLPRHRAAGITPAVVRASAGAAEHLAIAQETNLTRALQWLKGAGFWVIGLDQEGAVAHDAIDAARPVAVVVGSEGKGLTRLVHETCDQTARLPMRGRVGSLNAAVAGAILLYEVRRQRDTLFKSPEHERSFNG